MYSAFCQKHRKWAAANKVAMHIDRKPAQEMQVDYVGDTMAVLDLDTGELLKVYVFAACLPYSGELYAEGFFDMKKESWVEAHVHAFAFYGGSVPIIVPDNLKQGVVKNTVEELVVNEQYRRMAEYYGCAMDWLHLTGRFHEGLESRRKEVPTWQTPSTRGSFPRSSNDR